MKTIKTVSVVSLSLSEYQPKIDLSYFEQDDGSPLLALRFCYYINNHYSNRPLIISQKEAVDLLIQAIQKGLFLKEDIQRLVAAGEMVLDPHPSFKDLYGAYEGKVDEQDFRELADQMNDKNLEN